MKTSIAKNFSFQRTKTSLVKTLTLYALNLLRLQKLVFFLLKPQPSSTTDVKLPKALIMEAEDDNFNLITL